MLFRQIDRGDVILAYSGDNRIAYVGEVEDGRPLEATNNIVGDYNSKFGFDYPYQYKVTWFDKPHHFSRKSLPDWLWSQLGKRGKSVVQIDLMKRSFPAVKRLILATPKWMPKGS